MRTLIAVIVLSLANHSCVKKKNFEGKIIYKYADSTAITKTEVYFGKQKLKIKVKSFIEWSPYTMIILMDFENEVIYHINEGYKIYYKQPIVLTRKDLKIMKPTPSKNTKIFNYSCSAYQSFEMETWKDSNVLTPYQTYKWYADSIYYIIDKKHTNIDGLINFTNGTNICLGWEVSSIDSNISYHEIMKPALISSEQIPDSILSIPGNYKEVTEGEMSGIIHSKGEIMDEEMMEFKRNLPPRPYFPPPPPPPNRRTKNAL